MAKDEDWKLVTRESVDAKRRFINANKERLLRLIDAWVAETGLSPSESILVYREMPDGSTEFYIKKKGQ